MEETQHTSKKIINAPSKIVGEFIEGTLLANRKLKCIPGMNALVRSDIEKFKLNYVTLISGGGSGHEPAHAGYIGEGLLSAAVLGNCFASPSVNSILSTIRVCAGPLGVLLIVKNYTGDRLNFGMAAEKAKLEGIKVKMVIVADDCALQKGKGITGGRGIAGTVLVHKVAGAAAAAGLSLQEVFDEASAAAVSIATIGVAFSTCTVPGCPPSTRLDGPLFEVGMGIHGEPGREKRVLPEANTADTVADLMVEAVVAADVDTPPPVPDGMSSVVTDGHPSKESSIVLLVNNLGATPMIELYVVVRGIVNSLHKHGYKNIVRILVGPFMTAFDMAGVSLSLMRVDAQVLIRLDAPTTAPAWQHATAINPEESLADREISYSMDAYAGNLIKGGFVCGKAIDVVRAVVERIIAIEPQLTEYDMICGDGDCGIVMKAGAEKVLEYIGSLAGVRDIDSAILCDALANAVSAAMGGTSGALLEIMLRAMASSLINEQDRAMDWPSAISVGVQAIRTYGGASVGMRTMLDALIPGVDALTKGVSVGEAAQAAKLGAEATKSMEGLAGRSNYIVSAQMQGIPDPGAAAVAEAFDAAASIIM